MYLLDTDTLSRLQAAHPRAVAHLQALDDSEVATTVITKIELLQGRFDFMLKAATGAELLRAQYWLTRTEELLAPVTVLLLDDAAAAYFDRLRATRSLAKMGRADMLIASITLAHRATLVTRNVRHFRQIPNLSLTNWLD